MDLISFYLALVRERAKRIIPLIRAISWWNVSAQSHVLVYGRKEKKMLKISHKLLNEISKLKNVTSLDVCWRMSKRRLGAKMIRKKTTLQ